MVDLQNPHESGSSSPLSQLKVQIDALMSVLAQQEEALRVSRLKLQRANIEVILYGKTPPPDYTAVLGIPFETETFLVACIDLPIREQIFCPNGKERFSAEDVELMKGAIYSVFENALGPYCIASCCESDMCFANILINFPDEDQPAEMMLNSIDQALASAVALVQQNYGITLAAARSEMINGYQGLPKARIAAYQALTRSCGFKQLANTAAIVPANGIAETTPQPNAKLEKQYYQYVLSRDLHMAKQILTELTAQDLRAISFELAKLRLMNHLESLLNIYGIASSEISDFYLRPIGTEQEITKFLGDIFDDVESIIQESGSERKDKIQEISVFIAEHYADSSLCLAMLCDVFQMNQSYLSRTFKGTQGVGVLEYIHTQRLGHAKELLTHTAMGVDSIWQATGYTNRRTFNRTFKKLVGVSASEYRKSHKTLERD